MSVSAKTRAVTFACPKHGEYEGEILRIDFPGRRPMEFPSACPVCHRLMEGENARREADDRGRAEIAKWRDMSIEPRFYGADFDGFDAYNAELRGNLEACRAFAADPVGNLVMLGGNGNGKTHLAVSVLKAVGGVIYTAYEIGVNLRRSYNGEANEWEVLREICEAPLLVMDEVEKLRDSEAKQHWFSFVMGKRYNLELPTVFIANCHNAKDCKAPNRPCPRCLESHLENDVLSRVRESRVVLKFGSEDYRKKIEDRREGLRGLYLRAVPKN